MTSLLRFFTARRQGDAQAQGRAAVQRPAVERDERQQAGCGRVVRLLDLCTGGSDLPMIAVHEIGRQDRLGGEVIVDGCLADANRPGQVGKTVTLKSDLYIDPGPRLQNPPPTNSVLGQQALKPAEKQRKR
ncbi:hypothetical protein OKA06_20065 [Novosphingobium sp. MW5]|nr:hypothetical protein [Novosphingobium sp. MW5]